MKALTWRSVSGGIAGLAGIVLLAVAVLKYARTGVVRGDKFRLYVAVPDASNVLKGSDVWLNGQRVGTVARIDFAPATAPTNERVIIAADVLTRVRDHIRRDSRANLQSGGTIIGAPVVALTSGTPTMPVVSPGDTIRGFGKSDFEIAASRATEAMEELPAIMADAKVIAANAKAAGTRLSAIARHGGRSSFASQTRRLMQKLSSSRGSAGLLLHDQEIRLRTRHTLAAGDSLRALLSSRLTEVGRFRRDSTLSRSVRTLRDDVATLRALSSDPAGTPGRMSADSALFRSLDSLFVELNALMTDIRKNPLRYARVF